jgi:hypothetical protein
MLPAAWELKLGRKAEVNPAGTGIERPAGSGWG